MRYFLVKVGSCLCSGCLSESDKYYILSSLCIYNFRVLGLRYSFDADDGSYWLLYLNSPADFTRFMLEDFLGGSVMALSASGCARFFSVEQNTTEEKLFSPPSSKFPSF